MSENGEHDRPAPAMMQGEETLMSKHSKGPTTLSLFTESVPTPIGEIAIVTDERGHVRALDWDDHLPRLHRLLHLHYGAQLDGEMLTDGTDGAETFRARLHERSTPSDAKHALTRYFDGDIPAVDALAVATGGTPFQQTVWSALRRIPAGQTTSYSKLASSIGRARAVRAVGHANGSNPISIIVPCHRVVGASGQLTGYAGGLERKRWLLDHEASHSR